MKILPRNSAVPQLIQRPRVFVRQYRWELIVLVIGTSLDLFTTLWNVRSYGAGIEVHLVQRWFFEFFGEVGVPLAKLIQLGFVIAVAAWWRPWCRWILLLCAALYTAAAINNHFLLL